MRADSRDGASMDDLVGTNEAWSDLDDWLFALECLTPLGRELFRERLEAKGWLDEYEDD